MKQYIPYVLIVILCLVIWGVYTSENDALEALEIQITELKDANLTLVKNDSIESINEQNYRNRIDSILLLDSISLENSKMESFILKNKYRSLEKKYNHINGMLGELPEF